MIQIMSYEEDFYRYVENSLYPVVVYGAGTASQIAFPYFSRVDFFCDKNALTIKTFNKVPVLLPNELEKLNKKLIILVCVNKKSSTFEEICNNLNKQNIDAYIFNYYNNISFNCFHPIVSQINTEINKPLKVRLISYDNSWILSKFAKKLNENLLNLGVHSEIGICCDPSADINHHIAYHLYEPIKPYRDTLMITHVDSMNKIEQIKHQLKTALIGICMSRETMDMLVSYGVPRNKICYVNPGQDGVMKPKKYVLGITHRNHEQLDYRKKIDAIVTICKQIDPNYFSFKIMGEGWENVIKQMKELHFEVDYYSEFNYEHYIKLIPKLDYYLFFGFDEGSMGFLDALAAGVKTIVTPQGYHLDVSNGITHSCKTIDDFIHVLNGLKREREKLIHSVKHLTWENYTIKHLEIWNYLLQRKRLNELLKNKHHYNDGIFSVLLQDIAE